MATRIDFLELGRVGWKSRVVGFCSTPSKEVLQKMYPQFWVLSYRNRSLLYGLDGVAIRNTETDEKDYLTERELNKSKYAVNYDPIITPVVIGVDSSLAIDQFIQEAKKAPNGEHTLRQQFNSYIIPEGEKVYLLDLKGNWDPTPEDLAKLNVKVMINRISTGNPSEIKGEARAGWEHKSLSDAVKILLEDEPLKEMCEVFLGRDDLDSEILERYIIDNKLYSL